MMDSVADNPKTVIAYRGHYILNKENVVLSYREWLSNSNNFLMSKLFIHLCQQELVVFIIL